MTGALPFSEYNERLPFVAIQRPAGANAILLRQLSPHSSLKQKFSVFRFNPAAQAFGFADSYSYHGAAKLRVVKG